METVCIVSCSICCDNLCHSDVNPTATTTLSGTICTLECGHIFHSNCIAQWFRSTEAVLYKKCPVCQASFRNPPRVKTLYPSFQAAYAFEDLKKALEESQRSFNASEFNRTALQKKLDEKEAECRDLHARVSTLEQESLRQPFGCLGNLPAARAHNEVQRSPLDLRKSVMPLVPLPRPRTDLPSSPAEAPERTNDPIRRVRMLQRSATSLNPASRPPPGSYVNNSTETALSPRSRLNLFRERINRRNVLPND